MEHRTIQQCLVYCRVSSPKQVREGHGLESQESRCREYAKSKGYEVLATFHDEGLSGKLLDRPNMKAMLTFLRSYKQERLVVVIDDISRLARDIGTHISLRSAISNAGGRLESPSIEFGDDSDSRLVEHLLASVAAHQREKNAEQVVNRMRARALNGYWISNAPTGYRMEKVDGHGRLLVRDEPVASIVQNALESFASGRFETQSEVKRYLETQAAYPKDKKGQVHFQRVTDLLTRSLYAGRITLPGWGIHNHPGKHEPLISFQDYQIIQQRLKSQAKAPTRKDIRDDFPLRGFITCTGCGGALTSCYSKGRNKYYGYYLCHRKQCSEYGKSVSKNRVEGDFEKLLLNLRPSKQLFGLVLELFREAWEQRIQAGSRNAMAFEAELKQVDRKINNLLDRVVEADSQSLVVRYENRIRELEDSKIVMEEKAAQCGRIIGDFEEGFRTTFEFLGNPHKLWASEELAHKRMVLKLVFTQKLPYHRKEGFRTAPTTIPFKVLEGIRDGRSKMVGHVGFEPTTNGLRVHCSTS